MSNKHSPTLAVIFSVLLPGLGQFYNQETKKALSFFFGLILLSFVYSPLGLLVLVIASVEAFSKARRLSETGFVSQYQKAAVSILIAFIILSILAGFFGSSIISFFK
jgi:small neutral amino acid transporter SnatA (MarC family)